MTADPNPDWRRPICRGNAVFMLRFVRLCEEPFGRQTLFSRMPGYIIKPHHGEQPIEEHCNCEHISFEAARAETLAAARSLLGAKLWVSRMLNGSGWSCGTM